MVLPDTRIITEVVLYCSGFKNSHELSFKLIRLFEYARKQLGLGSSSHYDFGLRALKVIVVQASRLKLLCAGAISPIPEDIIKAKASLVNYMNKLTVTFTEEKIKRDEAAKAEENQMLKDLGIKVKRKTVNNDDRGESFQMDLLKKSKTMK